MTTPMTSMRNISFGGKTIALHYDDQQSEQLVNALFKDISQSPANETLSPAKISFKNNQYHYTLSTNQTVTLNDVRELAATIMSDIIHRLIKDNHDYLAIHAALIANDESSILMPAASGSGKSSLTTWCLNNGFYYHTDELVLINPKDFSLQAFTRPVKLRRSGIDPIKELIGSKFETIEKQYSHLFSSNTIMLPHRRLNSDYRQDIAPLKAIIYPQYDGNQASEITPLSSAQSSLYLMNSNVIARNFEDFGFANICELARQNHAYSCRFRRFDDLYSLFKQHQLI